MQTQTDMRTSTGGTGRSGAPVDDHTYNILQALTSTLESIEVYGKYQQDDSAGIFGRLLADEQRHADELLQELRSCLTRMDASS